jgi:ketosteroid isomerase-like protein
VAIWSLSAITLLSAFNDAINRRDLDSLRELMTDGHAFIDSDDNVLAGKDEVLKAWDGFFNTSPDYRNEWSRVVLIGGALIAVGRSVCSTEPALDGRRSGRLGPSVTRLPRARL